MVNKMVIISPLRIGLWGFPSKWPNFMAYKWGDPNYLLTGMILQVDQVDGGVEQTCQNANFPNFWRCRCCQLPPRNKGLIAGLIKGNQWLISPDHKALFLWGGYVARGVD